jgi:hypothetical protein
MSLFGRRPKNWSEIANDPHTPYMVGRLLGANEMAIIVLSQEDSQTAKNVAQILDRIQDYFIDEGTMMVAQKHKKEHPQEWEEKTTVVTKTDQRG